MKVQHKHRDHEKLKFFFYALIFVIIAGVTVIFVKYRFETDKEEIIAEIKDKASVTMAKVEHTATRDGAKDWSLKAKSVNYFQNNKEALFKDINVLFFHKGEPGAVLTADRGNLNTETNDMEASGNVKVVHDEFVLETETLDFRNDNRYIETNVPVKIIREDATITANSMVMDIDNNFLKMKGKVRGTFINKK